MIFFLESKPTSRLFPRSNLKQSSISFPHSMLLLSCSRQRSFWITAPLALFPTTASPSPTPGLFRPRTGRAATFASAMSSPPKKLVCAPTQRNAAPIWEVLSSKALPGICGGSAPNHERTLRILEVAAGSGIHTAYFAKQLSSWRQPFLWYPTDPSEESRASIECYIQDGGLSTLVVLPPMPLTLNEAGITEPDTVATLFGKDNMENLDLITCINMIHISPWSATLGLMNLASERLSTEGLLYCYGPYKVGGDAVESNLKFDQYLKSKNPEWGVRDLEAVCEAASAANLELVEKVEMPANNLSLMFRRRST